jgi:O-antigen/teichoic acid export membrane protein
VVAGYFGMLDLGLVQAVVKYASEYYGRGDIDRLGRLIGTANLLYLGLGSVGALIIAALTGVLVRHVLHIEAALQADATFVLYLAALQFLVNMPLSVFNALPMALQRMDITNARATLIGIGNSLGAVGLLALGYGLREVMLLNVALSVLGVFAFVIASRKLLPEVSFRPRFDREEARALFKVALPTAASSAGARAVLQFDRMLVSIFWPIAYLTYYTVPTTVCQQGMNLTNHVTRAMFPAVSDRSGNGDLEGVQRMYLRSTRLLAVGLMPVFVMLMLFAHPLLAAWAGPRIAQHSALVLTIVAAAFCFQFISALQNMFLTAMGQATLMAKWNVGQGLATVALDLLLIPRYGVLGAAVALLIVSAGAVLPYTYVVADRVVGLAPKRLVLPFLRPVLLSLICFLPATPFFGHLHRLLTVGLGLLGLGLVYLALARLCRALPQEDLALLWRAMRRKEQVA